MAPSKVYETRSLKLAAFLIESGYPYEIVTITESHKGNPVRPFGVWRFEDTEALRQKVQQFADGTATIEPNGYYERIVQVRTEVIKVTDQFSDVADNEGAEG